ncbi:MAG: sugar phosphate isomerase/epimerase [Phycisphaerae bacterium]|nr:sugar phosphate isomerase/epimerase [Phycisphaerae bacterium]
MSTLKQCVPDWCAFKQGMDAAAYYAGLKSIGFSGVEMVDPSRWAAARAAGLEIVTMTAPGMQKGLNRREHHAELVPQIRDAVSQAAAEHIKNVIVFSGNRDGQDDREGIANCRLALEELSDFAGSHGVTLLFEMLCAQDHVDYQADRAAYGFDLATQIDSPHFRVLYDLYHMHKMGEDLCGDLTRHAGLIAHLHTANAPKRDCIVPNGQPDYQPLVACAQRIGYTGYWGQEFLCGPEPLNELKRAFDLLESFA